MAQETRTQDVPAQVLLDLLREVHAWEPFTGPTGAHLWQIPGSHGQTYTVSASSCTCPADQYRHAAPCKHRQALRLYHQLVLAYLDHVRWYRRALQDQYSSHQEG